MPVDEVAGVFLPVQLCNSSLYFCIQAGGSAFCLGRAVVRHTSKLFTGCLLLPGRAVGTSTEVDGVTSDGSQRAGETQRHMCNSSQQELLSPRSLPLDLCNKPGRPPCYQRAPVEIQTEEGGRRFAAAWLP